MCARRAGNEALLTNRSSSGHRPYRASVEEGQTGRLGISPQMRACIESTSECYTACAETLNYSLDGGRSLADEHHLLLLIDCCEVLETTQNTLLRSSAFGIMMAADCVEACEKVAESCRRVDGSDGGLTACAEVSVRTADCCRQLAI